MVVFGEGHAEAINKLSQEMIDSQEQCGFCREWYPKPIALHHSDDECDLNVAEHSADYADQE